MNIKTYNYIKQCLEMGHEVKIIPRDESKGSQSYTHAKHFESFTMDNIDECTVEIVHRIPKLLQPGEKCYIIDTPETREYADSMEWLGKKKNLIGKEQKVSRVSNGYYFVGEDMNWEIPFFMVAPVPPANLEENKLADVGAEEMVKELESRGLLVDGKVLR